MLRSPGVLFVLVVAAACGSSGPDDAGVDDVLVTYEDISASGFIDQQVMLANVSGTAVVPEVRYTALDANGEEVRGITVGTAFGSDRGLLVVPPLGFYDVLTFEGARVADVVEVEAKVVAVRPVANYELDHDVEPEPLGADGEPLTKFDPFAQVSLTKSTGNDISFRVVCLLYDSPPQGQAQQAVEISVVVDGLTVPAGGSETTAVSPDFATRTSKLGYGCDSLKAHPTPLS